MGMEGISIELFENFSKSVELRRVDDIPIRNIHDASRVSFINHGLEYFFPIDHTLIWKET
jgi:hypothetical protein